MCLVGEVRMVPTVSMLGSGSPEKVFIFFKSLEFWRNILFLDYVLSSEKGANLNLNLE